MTDYAQWIPAAPPNRVLSDHIADQLREAIVEGQLEAGQRIVEREIAEVMQTSRGPVRDALLLLENEGLVVRSTHRGTFVARLTKKDAEEIWSLRLAIESVVVDYVLRRATPQDLDALDNLVVDRYSSWDGELGKKIEGGGTNFAELEAYIMDKGEASPNASGRQELMENIVNRYLDKA